MHCTRDLVYHYRDCLTRRMGDKVRPEKDRGKKEHCCELILQVFREPATVLKLPVDCPTKIGDVKSMIAKALGCKSESHIHLPTHDENDITIDDIQQEACNELVPSVGDDMKSHRNVLLLPCIVCDPDRDTVSVIAQAKTEKQLKLTLQPPPPPPPLPAKPEDKSAEFKRLQQELKAARQQIAELQQKNKSLKIASTAKDEQLQSLTLDRQILQVQLDELMSMSDI